jgi:ubiquinone/menaquinone biosynthesis C-methylase UbiE
VSSDRTLYSLLRRDAEANYSPESAAGYREADESARESGSHAGKCGVINELSRRFPKPVTVLDLGCGTGRYFHCLANVKMLVGVDPSENMLHEARRPVLGGTRNIHLVRSSLHEVAFGPATFDLVLCIGVIGLWCPLEPFVLGRIARMLKPDGVLFFSAIEFQPVPLTMKRRLALALRPLLFGPLRRHVDVRLREFTMPAGDVEEMSRRFFENVDVTRWRSPTSRVDLHCVMARPRPVVHASIAASRH